ncbi:hypothetical protein llap_8364 [Limosa lapponica baueri]|uniref:Flap endonuclease GEN chromatin organization modifier domain-containing protein n=1 Tax=Limosa lapponica baueri TaxID=1758121 RepID=A0A2I0U5J6_LIMLA|nr:hypothetical protein llap_8364 [Limosa lapponica baueri]
MSSIKEKLGCDRESLIGLAVLLGCDYLPKALTRNMSSVDAHSVKALDPANRMIPNAAALVNGIKHYVDAEDEPAGLFVITVEEESLFQAAYPDVVALYQLEKSEVPKKKQKTNWTLREQNFSQDQLPSGFAYL